MAQGDYVVETHGLTKRFGDRTVVRGVELQVPRGVAFGYLGPNGAGKTTLIRMLLGLTKANAGTMSLRGLSVPERRAEALSRVGAIVDEPRFHGHLTGRENLAVVAAARGRNAFARIEPNLERVGLAHRASDRVRTYSMGMRQRLGIARCLLADPELLIGVDGESDALKILRALPGVTDVTSDNGVIEASLTDIDVIPELNRRLVEAGVPVRRLEPVHASLEERFLAITSRLEDVE